MSSRNYPSSKLSFDWLFIIATGMWTAGAYIDGHAHVNFGFEIESFFGANHLLFYAGIFLTTALLVVELFRNFSRGYKLTRSLPREYLFALSGVLIALLGGLGDLVWHALFGFEVGIEALLGPTHLLLAAGGAIAVGGPLHAIWYRDRKLNEIHALPVILSFAYVFMLLTFMLQFLHPFNFPWPAQSFFDQNPISPEIAGGLGVANLIIYTGLLMGLLLSTIRHWIFPFGSFSLIIGLDVLAMTFMHGQFKALIIPAVLAGLFIDLLYRALIYPSDFHERHLRLFSFTAPIVLTFLYFVSLFITDFVWWSVHMWVGAIIISGIVGFLLTYLVVPAGDGMIRRKF